MLNFDKSTWKTHRFADVAANVKERTDDPAASGMDRYVGLEHLDPGSMTINRWGSPQEVSATKLVFQAGDVVFARRRAYQKKLGQADFTGIASAHALVLRAIPGVITQRFLPVFLSSDYFLNRAISISVGSLSPTVNWRDLSVQEFILPGLDEQERIADLLWAIERHARQQVALARVVSNLRVQLIGLLEPSLVPLGKLAEVSQGRSLPKAIQGQRTGQVPWYKIADMSAQQNEFGYEKAETMLSLEEIEKHGGRIVPQGAVVFPRVGAAVLTERKRVVLTAGAMDENHLILTPKDGVSSALLSAAMDSFRLASLVQGGVVPSLNMKLIRGTTMTWPTEGWIAFAEEAVREFNVANRGLRESVTRLRELRDSAIGAVFEGMT